MVIKSLSTMSKDDYNLNAKLHVVPHFMQTL